MFGFLQESETPCSIYDCCGNYAYDAAEGKGDVIEEEYFENCEWHIRALFEGERRVEESQQKCEGVGQTKVCVSYHAVAEDWGEMVDSEINVLDRFIEKEALHGTVNRITPLDLCKESNGAFLKKEGIC